MKRLAITLLAALASAVGAQDLAFTGANVFDGSEMLPAGTVVLVQNGVIAAVGTDVQLPDGIEVVDATGFTLLPGLIDGHVHTFYEAALEQSAVFGVTTVLDMFTDEAMAAGFAAAQAAGPATHRADIFYSGMLATAPDGHGTQFGIPVDGLTDPAQAEAWVDERVAAGASFIKAVLETGEAMDMPMPTLDDEILRSVIAAADGHGLLTVVHVQTLAEARQALAAGADGLAHIFTDEVADAEFVAAAAEAGFFVIATFPVFQSIGSEGVDETLANDPDIGPLLSAQDLQSLAMPYQGFEQLSLANGLESVRLLHEAGVPVLAGTDAMNPGTTYGASLHRELELFVEAGLTPGEALAAATSVPAAVFGLSDRGVISEGAVADLLLVDGDPTADILATRRIVGVWLSGVALDRESWAAAAAGQREAMEQQAGMFDSGEPVLISDFETGDLSVSFGQPWQPTTDEPAGGNSTVEIAVVPVDDGMALQVEGTVGTAFEFPWSGVMFMPAAVPFAPQDLSAVPNLAFEAAGTPGEYRVQLYCANLGQGIAEWHFEVGEEWQEHTVDLGTVGGCDPSGVMAIIVTSGTEGEFTLLLDNFRLE